MQYPATMQPTQARIEQVAPEDEAATEDSIMFPPVPFKMARNFCVTDTYYEGPTAGVAPMAYERTNTADFLGSFNGLGAVPDDVKELLPPECRQAFDRALGNESEWKSRWGPEGDKMARGQLVIDKAIVPYSMV